MLTGLNTATTYVGVSIAPLIGRAGLRWAGAHRIGPIGALLIARSLIAVDTAHVVIRRHRANETAAAHAA
ncbi:hypothetical protein ABT133_35200 [Streptomyces sp. NPDC001835]|uniref:hypothetical protein n=1 Tax=Streptomyces sp. NPDC001835 TaxID=3154528 RepID=UPI003321F6FD